MKLKIRVIDGKKELTSNTIYKNEIDAKNFKEISRLLIELENLGLPIIKSLHEFNLKKSDWNAVLGIE